MAEGRPNIPAPTKREVLLEAGHRCAIPTCRSTAALQIAHIVPWSTTQVHEFDNLIVLCANDHFRYDQGEIDRKAMLAYKRNLAVVSGRYNDFEQRMLGLFHERGLDTSVRLELSDGTTILVRNLVGDGLIEAQPATNLMSTSQLPNGGSVITLPMKFSNPDLPKLDMSKAVRVTGSDDYWLTDAGKIFVRRMFGAEEVEPEI